MEELKIMIGKLLRLLARIGDNSTNYSQSVFPSLATVNYSHIEIQAQDYTGNWRTYHITRNIPAMIISGMKQLASQYPGQRVRAVDTNGRIVDIL